MKKNIFIGIAIIFFNVAIFFAQNNIDIHQTTTISKAENISEGIADKQKFTEIDMVKFAQNTDSIILGEQYQTIAVERTVLPFTLNKYETTYALWYTIRMQAQNEYGYVFENLGQGGSEGKRGQKPQTKNKNQPVTGISWRDSVVWCNALSEIMDLDPCYRYQNEILRNSSDAAKVDLAECDFEKSGYRLPTETEWEYAARYIPSLNINQKDKSSFIGANEASGALWKDTMFQKITKTANVATAGSPFGLTSNPLSGKANYSGLYDMSGNILEYCWDWFNSYYEDEHNEEHTVFAYGSKRVARGGSWSPWANFMETGERYSFDPSEAYNYLGFRICQSVISGN